MNELFSSRAGALALAALTALPVSCSSSPERPKPKTTMIEGEPMIHLLPKDAIPSIDEPGFLSGAAADAQMLPDEPVLGVVGVDGTAKAYSAWQLEGHEIVNDTLDQLPVMVTW